MEQCKNYDIEGNVFRQKKKTSEEIRSQCGKPVSHSLLLVTFSELFFFLLSFLALFSFVLFSFLDFAYQAQALTDIIFLRNWDDCFLSRRKKITEEERGVERSS
jgi:hypothetical protein